MIDETDKRLRDWIGAIVGPAVPVSLAPPTSAFSGPGVDCYLLDIVAAPPERSTRPPPMQLVLRYIITTWDDDPLSAHRLLGQLVFAAMSDDTLTVEPGAVPLDVWRALGTPPRPCFVLRMPARTERVERSAPRVREPLHVATGASVPLTGVVVGPGDIPVMNARIEIIGLDASAVTDRAGRFRFATVPSAGSPVRLRVQARGTRSRSCTGTARSQILS